jgi:hypothetical protein
MTQRMFVCHAKSDIEATSEIVDALEGALQIENGTLVASSLPGYASDVRGEGELHATLTGAALMLALFTERSTYDPEFVFELGAAWALGIDVLPLLLGPTSDADVPWPLRDRPSIRAIDPTAWNDLVLQLSQRLQVSVRDRSQLAAADDAADDEDATTSAGGLSAPASNAFMPAEAPASDFAASEGDVPQPFAPVLSELESPAIVETAAAAQPTLREVLGFDAEPPQLGLPPEAEELAASLAAHGGRTFTGTEDRGALEEEDDVRGNPVSIVAPVMIDGVPAVAIPGTAPIPAEAFEPASDVRASLPSYRMALEAGRALSDCAFNREEKLDFTRELEEPFGRFVDAMGGSWVELSQIQDFDVWLGAAENLLQQLPDEGRQIGAWYEVGYELAILHNLAGQGLFDTEEKRLEAERMWRKALERFLIRAENANIPYEDLGRVLSLLENLVAPRAERDLANIARSLDELRTQAAGADRQHTAA